MQNEFYEVIFDWGDAYYFRNKDNAFEFAKQSYLNEATYVCADGTEISKDLNNLNEYYFIDGFVYINVKGFED